MARYRAVQEKLGSWLVVDFHDGRTIARGLDENLAERIANAFQKSYESPTVTEKPKPDPFPEEEGNPETTDGGW